MHCSSLIHRFETRRVFLPSSVAVLRFVHSEFVFEIVLSGSDGHLGVFPRPFIRLLGLIDRLFQSGLGLVAHGRRRLLQHPSLLHDKRMHDYGGFGGGRCRRCPVILNGIIGFVDLPQDVFETAASFIDVLDPALDAEPLDPSTRRRVPLTRHPKFLLALREGFS